MPSTIRSISVATIAFFALFAWVSYGENCLSFNGNTDHLQTYPDPPAFTLKEYSMAIWVKRPSINNKQMLMMGYGKPLLPPSYNVFRSIMLGWNNSIPFFSYSLNYQNIYVLSAPSANTDTTSWHFVAGTYNMVTKQRNLIFDGNVVASDMGTYTYLSPSIRGYSVGAAAQGIDNGNAFDGYLSRAYFFNRPLDAGELYNLYAYNSTVSLGVVDTTGLVFFHTLNFVTGQTNEAAMAGGGGGNLCSHSNPSCTSLWGTQPSIVNDNPFTTGVAPPSLASGRKGTYGGINFVGAKPATNYAYTTNNVDLAGGVDRIWTVNIWAKPSAVPVPEDVTGDDAPMWSTGNVTRGVWFTLSSFYWYGGVQKNVPVLGTTASTSCCGSDNNIGENTWDLSNDLPEVTEVGKWHMWTVIVDLWQPGFHILCDATTQVYLQPLSDTTLIYSGAPSKFYLGKDITGVKTRGFSGRLANLKIWQRGLVVPRHNWHSDSSSYYTDYNNVHEVGNLFYGNAAVSSSNLILNAPLQGGLWEFQANNHFIAYGSNVDFPMSLSERGPCEVNSKIINCTTVDGCTNRGIRDETIYGNPTYVYNQAARFDLPYTFITWYKWVDTSSSLDLHCQTTGESTGSGVKITSGSSKTITLKAYESGSPSPAATTTTSDTINTGWNFLHVIVPSDGHHITLMVNGATWKDNTALVSPSSVTLAATLNFTCTATASGTGKIYDSRMYTGVSLFANTTFPTYCALGPQNFPA